MHAIATGAAGFHRPHPPARLAAKAFTAMLLRDLTVLRKNPGEFLARTIVQPLLLVFVLGYVNPKIGLGPGGAGATRLATTLVAGMLAIVTLFQGIQGIAIPLVREFGFTREIEDRVLAPLPGSLVALEKVAAGALQGLLAALVVFPSPSSSRSHHRTCTSTGRSRSRSHRWPRSPAPASDSPSAPASTRAT
jgi:ABC-2 type transport system permease protein